MNTLADYLVLPAGVRARLVSWARARAVLVVRLQQRNLSAARLYALLEPLSYEVILMLRACNTSVLLRRRIEDFLRAYNGVRLSVGGDDLKRLGIPPGPQYNTLLTRLLRAKLDGRVRTQQEELGFLKKYAKASVEPNKKLRVVLRRKKGS